ncbi:MAG: DegV family protein [Anaerolineales bacterium]|nr:DegV family protein [Anaerolineales bacterium]
MGTAFMCRAARQMERAGKSVDEIVKFIEGVRSKTHVVLTLETLEYARRSQTCRRAFSALAIYRERQTDCFIERRADRHGRSRSHAQGCH